MAYPSFLLSVLLLFCCLPAGAGSGEIGIKEFMERLPDMLESAPQPPEVTEAQVVELEDGDYETYIFVNEARDHPPRPVNFGGDGRLSVTRQDNGEHVSVRYRRKNGSYDPAALAKLNRVMHCSLTGRETAMSVRLIEILDVVEDKFGKKGIVLLSGYRTPTLNARVKGAARRSTHMLGWAADIRIPGHTAAEIEAFARKGGAGGVGFYPDAGFVHLDAGRPRNWTVRSAPSGKPAPVKVK
jgi:uncharacterized protein YcbK (DUF882 family)